MTDPTASGGIARLRMHIIADWHFVLRRAWSVRLLAASFVLDGLEAAVNVVTAWHVELPIPPGAFAVLAGLTTAAAGAARFIAQRRPPDV